MEEYEAYIEQDVIVYEAIIIEGTGIELRSTDINIEWRYIGTEEWFHLKSLSELLGKSQYQSYLDTTDDNPPLTEKQWSDSFIHDISLLIEKIKRNGVELQIVDKTVNIVVPTKLSELEEDILIGYDTASFEAANY